MLYFQIMFAIYVLLFTCFIRIICRAYKKSRKSRDIYVKKSRVFNVAQILQNLAKFYHFHAVFSDFGGFSGGTNCRAY